LSRSPFLAVFALRDAAPSALYTLSLHDALPIYYCLIYGVWFFPEMGYMGVAYGTLLSRIIMLIYMYFALKSNATLSPFINRLTLDRKSTRLNSSHVKISYAVFCLKKKKKKNNE